MSLIAFMKRRQAVGTVALRIGPLELISSVRPEALDQASDARFVIVIYRACRACLAALSHGGHALWLNASVPAQVGNIGAHACCLRSAGYRLGSLKYPTIIDAP